MPVDGRDQSSLGTTVKVLAVDPGLETGIARFNDARDARPTTWSLDEEHMHIFICELERMNVDLIVCEAFIITTETGRKTQAPWSLEWIGVLRHWCWQTNTEFDTTQKAGDAKAMITNDVLRKLGWWVVGSKGHDNDAQRHLALALLKRRQPLAAAYAAMMLK